MSIKESSDKYRRDEKEQNMEKNEKFLASARQYIYLFLLVSRLSEQNQNAFIGKNEHPIL